MFAPAAAERITGIPLTEHLSDGAEFASVEDLIRFAVAWELSTASVDPAVLVQVMSFLRASKGEFHLDPILTFTADGFVFCKPRELAGIIAGSDGETTHIIDLEALDLRIRLAASLEVTCGTPAS